MQAVNLYWSRFEKETDEDLDHWSESEIQLSELHKLSLLSHLKLGHKVYLHTHQKIPNVPSGITITDASPFLSRADAHESLCQGHSIAHISDMVRLGACLENGGVMCDMDGVMLKSFPDVEGFIASAPAKKSGGFAPKWGESHPPIFVRDGSWDGKALAAVPMKVSPKSRDAVSELIEKIRSRLKAPRKDDTEGWNFVMWAFKRFARKFDDCVAYPPEIFCPIPAWLPAGKCYTLEYPTRLARHFMLYGHHMSDSEDILSTAVMIQHFFESAFQDAPLKDNDFWMNVHQESFLAMEAEFVIGKDWQKILSQHSHADLSTSHVQAGSG